MCSGYRLAAMLALVMVSSYLAFGQQSLVSADIEWRTDYAKALVEARQSSKPLFVVFSCLH